MLLTVSIITVAIIASAIVLGHLVNAIAEFFSDVFDMFVTGLRWAVALGVATGAAFLIYYMM